MYSVPQANTHMQAEHTRLKTPCERPHEKLHTRSTKQPRVSDTLGPAGPSRCFAPDVRGRASHARESHPIVRAPHAVFAHKPLKEEIVAC